MDYHSTLTCWLISICKTLYHWHDLPLEDTILPKAKLVMSMIYAYAMWVEWLEKCMLSAQDKWDNGKLSLTPHWPSFYYNLSSTNSCTISLVEWGELLYQIEHSHWSSSKGLGNIFSPISPNKPTSLDADMLSCASVSSWNPTHKVTLGKEGYPVRKLPLYPFQNRYTKQTMSHIYPELPPSTGTAAFLWTQITLLVSLMMHYCKKESYKLNRRLDF